MNPWWSGLIFAVGVLVGIRWNRWSVARWEIAIRRLNAALADGEGHFVLDLERETGVSAARLHVLLARFERQGAVMSWWIDGTSPRRRCYRLANVPEVRRATH